MPTTRPMLARLFVVHHAIAEGRTPSLRDLAELCEVDPRTIKRDLRTLREMYHAPLIYCAASHGYRYTSHFTLDNVNFSEGELLTLCLMRTFAGALHNTHLAARMDGLFGKLQALLPEPAQGMMHEVDGAVSYLPDPAPPEDVAQCIVFNDLLRAIEENRQVSKHA
ncbi:MAG TPA: hypothetical protein VHV83_14850 [Armatimonadota bacterium]|nr:hypothetical protein [Armatimonadota bacterium]